MGEKQPRVLIVDDEPNIHYSFEKILSSRCEISSARSAEEGIHKFETEHPAVVIMDIKMPGMDGLQAIKRMRESDAKVPIIIMTAYGTVNTAITAMKYGAYEYLLKPFDVEQMRRLVLRAAETSSLMKRAVHYKTDPQIRKTELGDAIIGSSEPMQMVYKLIGQVAAQHVTVLILGESGTGKELVARAIYHHSKRKDQPFLEINCAALPETLLESELFGFEKGAFTGAFERRIGKFEQANAGTMLLDEVGEMSLQTQAKILRVIQTGEFTRLGGNEVVKTDVRLIVATNRSLKEAIREGLFREDLYYRLNVITIKLPPLRERKEDIPALVRYFLDCYCAENDRNLEGIDRKALKKLSEYSWPGNVRQLENCIRRAAVLAKSDIITDQDLQLEMVYHADVFSAGEDDEMALEKIMDHIVEKRSVLKLIPTVEKMLIGKALRKTSRNQVQAAKLLGINRNTLRNRMQKYGL